MSERLLGYCCRSRFASWDNDECQGDRPPPKITNSPFRPKWTFTLALSPKVTYRVPDMRGARAVVAVTSKAAGHEGPRSPADQS